MEESIISTGVHWRAWVRAALGVVGVAGAAWLIFASHEMHSQREVYLRGAKPPQAAHAAHHAAGFEALLHMEPHTMPSTPAVPEGGSRAGGSRAGDAGWQGADQPVHKASGAGGSRAGDAGWQGADQPVHKGQGEDGKAAGAMDVTNLSRGEAQTAVLAALGHPHLLPPSAAAPVPFYRWRGGGPAVGNATADACTNLTLGQRDLPPRARLEHISHVHKIAGEGYAHMAMVEKMPAGALWKWLVMWQASSGVEGTGDQELEYALSDSLRTWGGKPLRVPIPKARGRDAAAVWSPVLHLSPRGELWLFFSQSTSCLRHNHGQPPRWAPGGDIAYMKSVDGVTWTRPVVILTQAAINGVPKVIANRMVVHSSSGAWVLPYWSERPHQGLGGACKPRGGTASGVLVSRDEGATWQPHGKLRPKGHGRVIEGSVAEMPGGDILQLFRTNVGCLMRSVSRDGGETWSDPECSSLPNPSSKASITTLRGYGAAVAFNDDKRHRAHLRVAWTADGVRYHRAAQVEAGTTSGSMYQHYPTVLQEGCTVIVAYSWMHHPNHWVRKLKGGGIKLAELFLTPAPHRPGGGASAAAAAEAAAALGGGGGGETWR